MLESGRIDERHGTECSMSMCACKGHQGRRYLSGICHQSAVVIVHAGGIMKHHIFSLQTWPENAKQQSAAMKSEMQMK